MFVVIPLVKAPSDIFHFSKTRSTHSKRVCKNALEKYIFY